MTIYGSFLSFILMANGFIGLTVFSLSQCVGFDLEGIYTLGRDGRLSLIQISDDKNVWLIDMVALKQTIPKSLAKWLRSEKCCKFIHDSRQDQDALYHCHDIELGGIFDTTVWC